MSSSSKQPRPPTTEGEGRPRAVDIEQQQAAVAFQGMPIVMIEDRLFLPVLQPAIARDVSVVGGRPYRCFHW